MVQQAALVLFLVLVLVLVPVSVPVLVLELVLVLALGLIVVDAPGCCGWLLCKAEVAPGKRQQPSPMWLPHTHTIILEESCGCVARRGMRWS